MSKRVKKEITVEDLRKVALKTYIDKGKKGVGIWYKKKYIEVLEWPIPLFKDYDIINLWKTRKEELQFLGYGMRKIGERNYRLFFDVSKINNLRNKKSREFNQNIKDVSHPCPYCGEQVVHTALYYYECSDSECDFAFIFDPSDPNRENQIKITKKRSMEA